ncbi:MAG: hypothetical protein IKS16_08695, partial [Lachnospiraceae bacterium]|nr:hypothetical protein [Lachnospiraceae bacterium]
KLKAAETTLEELKQDQKQAGEDLQKTIDRLTPRPSGDDDDNPGVPGQPGDPGTGGDGGSTSGTPAASTRPTAGNRTADADGGAANDGVLGARNGGRGGRGGRAAAAGNGGEELLNIGDEAPALAGSIADATDKKADEEVKKVDNVNIEDADPALASFNDVNEESHDWLWWILALLAGAVTIEEFTRRQRNKKKAAQTETSGK